jgi:type VI secretion system protein ImpH
MPDLISKLRRAPHEFDLFQAISLIERAEPSRAPVGQGLGMDEALRLAGDVELGFAASDIGGLAASGRPGPPLTLRTAALTLAGAQGPLAAPFTELLMSRRRQRDYAGLDFLDIFNHRLLSFWYRARGKHHLALKPGAAAPKPEPGGEPPAPLPRTLDALSGLGRGEGAHGPAGELAWLRHAGLQGAAPRSMASLLTLLRDRTGVAFDGQQFIGLWHPLAPCDRARLQGSGVPAMQSALGQGASLGARAWDQSAAIMLSVPPQPPQRFAALLPDGALFALLGWLVARHQQRDLSVMLTLAPDAAPATRLGQRGAGPVAPRLGRSAWLCSRPGDAAEQELQRQQQQRRQQQQQDRQFPYQHPRFVLSAPDAGDTARS